MIHFTLRQIRKWTGVDHLVCIYIAADQALAIRVAKGRPAEAERECRVLWDMGLLRSDAAGDMK